MGCNFVTEPAKVESRGQTTSLHCAEKVTLDSPYCGEGEDVFVVCARLRLHKAIPKQKLVQLVGYKALQRYLSWAQFSKRCSHAGRLYQEVKLAIGCSTIAGFGHHIEDISDRIVICLTAHSVGARWLSLATFPSVVSICDSEDEQVADTRRILLGRDDCCLQSVIDQAAAEPGYWFIIQ